jgi:magnesium chelatase accessory protein
VPAVAPQRDSDRLRGAALDWRCDGAGWPNAAASRFVEAGGLRWHVQDMGGGPALLLLHGTGASTHSWGGLAPLLAPRFRVIAPDLPGHGFSAVGPHSSASLPGMARACAALVDALGAAPALVVGHSAGAAILARMCLDGALAPRGLVSLNGALLPLRGLAGQIFGPAARLLATLPPVPRLFARRVVSRALVERLIRDTGSRLPDEGVALYHRLLCSPGHVGAALRMMANWDLEGLARQLPQLAPPLFLVACENDRTVPPSQARHLARLLAGARLQLVPGLGHLGHEEDPPRFAALIEQIADQLGLAGSAPQDAQPGP